MKKFLSKFKPKKKPVHKVYLDCRFIEMFDMQKTLNRRIGVDTDVIKLSEEEQRKWVLRYVRATQQELAELTDSVPWKWWASYQKLDVQNAKVEVIDLFHFVISLAQVLGMDAREVFTLYSKKMEVNHNRQKSGYTHKDPNDCKGVK